MPILSRGRYGNPRRGVSSTRPLWPAPTGRTIPECTHPKLALGACAVNNVMSGSARDGSCRWFPHRRRDSAQYGVQQVAPGRPSRMQKAVKPLRRPAAVVLGGG
ncbi:hypothetical protein GCM10028799_39460 [Kribbella italica]